MNLSGVVFCGLSIVLAIAGQLSLSFITQPWTIVVASMLIATQILRNHIYAAETRDMSVEIDVQQHQRIVIFKGSESSSDVFNSMNKNTEPFTTWEARVPLSRIAWIEKTVRGVVVHCDDNSMIMGRLSKKDYNVLCNGLSISE